MGYRWKAMDQGYLKNEKNVEKSSKGHRKIRMYVKKFEFFAFFDSWGKFSTRFYSVKEGS